MDAKYETIINGIQNLINTTIQCENENGRRCINTDDLNEFETWIDMLSDLRALAKMNPTNSKQLATPAVSKCEGLQGEALLEAFIGLQDYIKEEYALHIPLHGIKEYVKSL